MTDVGFPKWAIPDLRANISVRESLLVMRYASCHLLLRTAEMTAFTPSLSIGELATGTEVSVCLPRHYGGQGVLVAGQCANGYRHVSVNAVAQVG